jgi:hypothetical protein
MGGRNFTKRQLDALDLLKKHYPQGCSMVDPEDRAVFDSLIARGTGLVELVETDETPTGDAYVLTDADADAFREDADERGQQADWN